MAYLIHVTSASFNLIQKLMESFSSCDSSLSLCPPPFLVFNKGIGVLEHLPSFQYSLSVFILEYCSIACLRDRYTLPNPSMPEVFPLPPVMISCNFHIWNFALWETHVLKLHLGNYSLGEKHLIGLLMVMECSHNKENSFFQIEDFSILKNTVLWSCLEFYKHEWTLLPKYRKKFRIHLLHNCFLASSCFWFCWKYHEMTKSNSFISQILLAYLY